MQRKVTGRAGAKDTGLMGDVAAQGKARAGGDVWLGGDWSMPGTGSGQADLPLKQGVGIQAAVLLKG